MGALIKLDENLPVSLVPVLMKFGYEAATVHQQGWTGLSDEHLFPLVSAENRFFITSDKDFSDCLAYPPGSHPGILILAPAQVTGLQLKQVLTTTLQSFKIEDLWGCVAVATDHNFILRRATP